MTQIYDDGESTLHVSRGDGDNTFRLQYKNLYGENVTRDYKFSDSYDMADFLEEVSSDLSWWGLNYNLQEILDDIDDYLYEIGICY